MLRCVDLAVTDVSEERTASIFRVEKSASGEPAWAGGSVGSLSFQKTTFFIMIINRCFENSAQFRYLVMTVTNQNFIRKEIKRIRIMLAISQFITFYLLVCSRGSVVVKALCCKPEGRGLASRWGGFFQIVLILPVALWLWGRLSL
jgi:hypothetical protein